MLRWAIQIGLVLMFSITVALVASVPMLGIAGLLHWLLAFHFWPTWWLLLLFAVVAVGSGWAYKQRQSDLKVIRDFPKPGDLHKHHAEWKGENFDRLLSVYVRFARAANAIDENRKDFHRVEWGQVEQDPYKGAKPPKLIQMWFAGNHSDIGGSYPETESRLSDNALWWMIEQATAIPNGIKLGPTFVNGTKIPGTGDAGTPLNLYARADGVQHCELAGMRDTIDGYVDTLPNWMRPVRGWLGRLGWPEEMRKIPNDARVHESVRERFKFDSVVQCAGHGPYRPEALRHHDEFKTYYPPL